jgi:membrane protein DedA with SNARE-associated domain
LVGCTEAVWQWNYQTSETKRAPRCGNNKMLDAMIADLTNPIYWLVVLAFTIFGLANRLVFYQAGKRGGEDVLDRIHGYSPERVDNLHSLYDRWGSLLFLITSIPVIGSSLTVLCGMKGVSLPIFIVLAVISYLIRNWLIVLLSSGAVGLFQ